MLVLAGCFAETAEPAREHKPLGSLENLPDKVTDAQGQVWVQVDVVDPDAAPFDPSTAQWKTTDPMTMTVEQAAEYYRPYMAVGGNVYTLEQPPIELAKRILSGEKVAPTAPYLPSELEQGQEQVELPGSETRDGQRVFGGDDRQRVTNTGSYPFSAIAAFRNAEGCTATRVGPNTVLTAAHCVHNGDSFLTLGDLDFGVSQVGNVMPFTRVPGLANRCYSVTVPGGWVTDDFDGDEDYNADVAVIQLFPGCPQNNTGWLGVTPDLSESSVHFIYGYPGHSQPDAPRPCQTYYFPTSEPELPPSLPFSICFEPGVDWFYPTMWGIGNASLDDDNIFFPGRITHTIDMTKGQSGSAIYGFYSLQRDEFHADPAPVPGGATTGRYVVGINTGDFSFIASINYGVDITSGWMTFFQQYGGLGLTTDANLCFEVCEGFGTCYNNCAF